LLCNFATNKINFKHSKATIIYHLLVVTCLAISVVSFPLLLHRSVAKSHRFIIKRKMSEATTTEKELHSYWLLKSEPDEYSLDDLEEDGVGSWDGIRNYQARNYLKSMKVDDFAYFYYSNCKEPGIVGEMKIVREFYPDAKALDSKSKYYDSRATEEKNPWVCVAVQLLKRYKTGLPLSKLKLLPLGSCPLTSKGNRLSVIPITTEQHIIFQEELKFINDVDS